MKILVINPGATSTKICVFEDEEEVMRVGIDHDASEIAKYPHVVDQAPFRKAAILETIEKNGYKLEDSTLSAEEADSSSISHRVHTR
jgi:butyrate kinase